MKRKTETEKLKMVVVVRNINGIVRAFFDIWLCIMKVDVLFVPCMLV